MNSRFAIATHVLTLLASSEGESLTSEYMASSVNTNPVVIRRVLGRLRDANLVRSHPGPGGGWHLARPARGITLRDVYRAVEGEGLFAMHASEPNPRCPVGTSIQEILIARFDDAQLAMEAALQRTRISHLLGEVRMRGAR
jgi:Rrf2 family protein